MDVPLPLEKMSVEEKLRAMELLWENLSRTPSDVPSPDWHRDVLEAREKRVRKGQEKVIPWDEAKQSLRSRKA